jgi:hypothetical protein
MKAELTRLPGSVVVFWCAMRFHHLAVLLLLPAAAFCADYQVVFKDSGKVIHGDFVQEDAKAITLKVGNTEVSFRKEALDLKRMRELNSAAGVPSAGSVRQPPLPSREVGLATIGKLERQIEEREETLAGYREQPPSAARDRKIHEAEEELRLMRNAREDLRLEYGISENPELLRLRKVSDEAFAEAEEAQREYDSLPPGTSQAEVAIKWERFQSAEKKWQEGHAALLKALQEEADRTRSSER